jgi:acyl transferase domain-containing protein
MRSDHDPRPPVAVVGVSALFPGSHDATGFWSDICRGADLLGDVPASHWLIEDYYDPDPRAPDKTYAKRGGFLTPVDFDPIAWGVPPKILRATDTTQLLALVTAEQVLRDAAGGRFETMDRSRISVILGVTSAQELISTMTSRLQRPVWTKALREQGLPEDEVTAICDRIASSYVPWEESSFPGLLGNVVAGRIANRLDLGGTNCVTDAACASTFAALNMALQELYLGDSELVITGGADTLNDIFMFMCFSKTPALSMTGDCRPFSDQADGTMLGEGLGMVALKRLDDAERDGDHVYAVIRGIGSSSDGRSKSVYAPVSAGQAMALRRAQQNAGITAETVELLEAHGTGTKAGDVAEFNGLRMAFESSEGSEGATQWCALGSVKSQIGHTKAAAGAAGLFKAVMAVHHKVLPPTIKVDLPNPKLEVDSSPFYLNTEARPWVRPSDHPRRAGVSAFGFGGSNFHVVVEEYTGQNPAKRLRTHGPELIVISGADGAAVAAAARTWAARCDEPGLLEFAAWTSQAQFDPSAPARLAVIADSAASLRTKLERAASAIAAAPGQAFESPDGSCYGLGQRQGEVGLLFPGQGSQYVGMTGELAQRLDVVRAAWDRAAELELGGERLDHKVFPIPRFDDAAREGDDAALRATQWAQPAIGCASLGLLGLVEALGIEAKAVAGHSFGEVTALHAAGVLADADVLKVARRRGELMAEAGSVGRPGTMSAVVGSAAQVEATLAKAEIREVVLANLNAPTQTVISGPTERIEAAEQALRDAGMTVKRLPVASAFHSPVVSASAAPFTEFLAGVEFGPARVPVYSGESGAPYEAEAEAMRARLGRQIAEPVRFTATIEAMADAGIHTFIEVGPGAVLSNLVGQILGQRPHAAIALDRKGAGGPTMLLRGLARLATLGVPLRFAALWQGYAVPEDPASKPKPKLIVPISGTNHEKPYPPPGGAAALPKPNPPRAPLAASAVASSSSATHTAANGSRAANGSWAASPSPSPAASAPRPASAGSASAAATTSSTMSVAPRPFVSEPAMSDRPSSPPSPTPQPFAAASSFASGPSVGDGWLAAWQEAQRQTAHTHAAVQQAMASSHAAYLRATEVGLMGLAAMAGVSLPSSLGQVETVARGPQAFAPALAPVPHSVAQPVAPAPAYAQPVTYAQPAAPAPAYAQPSASAQPVASTHAWVQPSTQPVAPTPVAPAPVAAPALAAAPAPVAAAAPALDLEALMLKVVADKTGYPESMLELSMDMEAELGIDSIKRVEILAAVQEQAPSLPEIDAGHMGSLRTLGEIVAYMQSLLGPVTAVPAATRVAAPPAPAAAPAAPGLDLEALMLKVVADKTGYPEAMLELSMDMEAELGIDSIKRVEILAAVQEQAPSLPEIDAGHMGALRTLGEIVAYMQSLLGPVTAAPAATSVAAATSAAPGLDLEALMLAVVADKTGYPEAMLELSMDMEAELGIDSIKRVEILAAVQEQAPGLPEIDAGHMGALRTLGEIVAYMQSLLGPVASAVAAPVAAATPSTPAVPSLDLAALMLAVVADKTGYPEAMLELSMDMEAELGIDSIKRVEILAAVQEQAPGLPEIDASHMGSLRTLGDIVAYMQSLLGPQPDGPGDGGGPSKTSAVEVVTETPALGRYALELVAAPAVGLAQAGLHGPGGVLVTGHATLGPALATELGNRGVSARYVAAITAEHASASAVVSLAGLRELASVDEALAINHELFATARTVATKLGTDGGLFVSVQDSGGGFGLEPCPRERAWLAGLPALIKTAKQEWPEASVQAIDLDRAGRAPAALAKVIADELLLGGGELEVALAADGRRRTLRSFASELAPASGPAPIQPGEVVVVSGGARGVTAACVIAYAKRTRAKFVLLGRSALEPEPSTCVGITNDAELKRALLADAQARGEAIKPAQLARRVAAVTSGREIRATLAAIAQAGGEARYLSVDVTDAAAVAAALAEVRREWGPIAGLVHGAGVLADKRIAELSDDAFAWVFKTKIDGLRALLAATTSDPLKVLCLFSSVSARCGNNGQAAYAIANEVLNKVAQVEAQARPGCRVRALDWGPWEGGMVSPQLREHFARLGVPMIPLELGAQMFADELSHPADPDPTQVELVLGGEPRPEALLVVGAEARTLALEVHVDRRTHAYLADHSIAGTVVVPVVLALEWVSRVARAFRPDLHLRSIRNLKVLRGIKLGNFEAGGDRFTVRCRQLSNGDGAILGLEIVGADGALHYRAEAQMSVAQNALELGPAPSQTLRPWGDAIVYGDVLFHGRDFQVIDSLDGVGDDGISGVLRGVHGAGWEAEPWQTDVAAHDGGLQLAVLWARERLGGASLPMGIGEVRFAAAPVVEGPLRVVASCRKTGPTAAVADVILFDSAGTRVSELRNAELVLRPDQAVVQTQPRAQA